jgi:arginine-tRNA-protein transferase
MSDEGPPLRSQFHFLAPPSPCGYLPEQRSRMEYEQFARISAEEYASRMLGGWRRFGRSLFRPRCNACDACRPIRVDVKKFSPSRSQRRTRVRNEHDVTLTIGPPRLSDDALDLYHRFHAFQEESKGWPSHDDYDASSFAESFLDNPFPTEEWRYTLDGRLIGLGFVDVLPPVGLSAIYFVHDPEERSRSLGTWNVLRLIEETANRGLPHLYLGYFIAECRSMAYKAAYRPNEIRHADGVWRPFLDA